MAVVWIIKHSSNIKETSPNLLPYHTDLILVKNNTTPIPLI